MKEESKMLRMDIKPGEGGSDAIDLVKIMQGMYEKFFVSHNISYMLEKDDPHHVCYRIGDSRYNQLLLAESGGHRWQRVPPTEKRGRVHTSTVKVSVQREGSFEISFSDSDFEFYTTKDSGPGGQHRNKTESCVVMTHVPTGIKIKQAGKCQRQNRKNARRKLEKKVGEELARKNQARSFEVRRQKMGPGMRGDKIRTIGGGITFVSPSPASVPL